MDEPTKRWKFNPDDLKERKLWPVYTKAYEDVLSKTSTERAPWFIVPGNRKWYRNLCVARIMVDTLEALDMQYPQPTWKAKDIVIDGEKSGGSGADEPDEGGKKSDSKKKSQPV